MGEVLNEKAKLSARDMEGVALIMAPGYADCRGLFSLNFWTIYHLLTIMQIKLKAALFKEKRAQKGQMRKLSN